MARTFLGLIVAVLLVFVIADASRGQTNQGGQRIQNRGTTRYHSKSTTEANSFSASTTRSPRNKNSRSETISDITQHETRLKTPNESAVSSRTGVNRHANLSIDNIRNRPKSHTQTSRKEITRDNRHDDQGKITDSPETSKQQTASRRVSSETSILADDSAKLNLEVFTKSSGYSRSRTGRKIYTNLNGQESRSHRAIPPRKSSSENVEKIESPKNESEKEETRMEHSRMIENLPSKVNASIEIDAKGANNLSNHKDETKERDIVLSGSESVRVDIPLTVGNDEDKNSNLLASTTILSTNVLSSRQTPRPVKEKVEGNDIAKSSTKKSRQSDRSKSRTRSNANDPNFNVINLGSVSRRGTSKFASTVPAEMSERSSRHKSDASKSTRSKSRNRSAHKSKATAIETKSNNRSRIIDLNSETNGRTEKRRTSSNDRRTSEGKRRSNDNRSKVVEIKTSEQDVRTQRGRSRPNGFDITTAYIPKATIAEATTVSSVATEMTTFNSASVTTKASTIIRTFSTERASRNKGRDKGENARLKKPPKEDFFNYGLGFRGRKSSTERLSSTVADLKTTTAKSETQLRGNPGWTLRRRPNHVNYDTPSIPTSVNRDQVNEIILSNDSPTNTDTPSSNIKTGRRGTKRPKTKDESNTVSGIAAKDVTRGSKTFNKSESFGLPKKIELEESDNYPPAFRARLNQLKNSNLKPTEAKSTTRAHSQATKSSAATLFSERSKMKLDLARRLIKPELNIDENKYDITTIPYSGKLKTKEITVSESRNVEKTTKANKIHGVRVLHESLNNEETEKSRARARWKFLESRKSLKDRNFEVSSGSPTITTRKSRVITEKTTSSSVERISTKNAIEFNAIPRGITVSHHDIVSLEETTTIDAMKIRSPVSQNTAASKEEIANTMETIDNSIGTSVEPMKLNETSTETPKLDITSTTNASESTNISTTEFPQEVTLSPSVTTFRSKHSSVMIITPEKVYPVYIPDTKKSSSEDKEKTKFSDDITKNTFRPRYTKQEQPDKVAVSMVTSKTVGPTSRYIRKKADVFTPYDAVPKSPSTEPILTKRREFRPRTATYRRHSEMPNNQLIQQITKKETTDITITPKSTKYHAQIVTPSTRSVSSEPFVSVTIDTSNDTMPSIPDIAENNNSSSNSKNSSNIFNPMRNVFLNGNTTTFLDQLRSTVAPLLNALSNKTPIFSSAYSNVDTGNLAPRITPNGSPPRFSARYKGAELFVRKPSIDQVVVPSITTSSTTASTPLENSGLAPPVDINSPGEPRFVTFYRALESASIRNENLGVDDVSQQQQTLTGGVTKVDSNAPVHNSASNDTANNNDTATIITTSFPDTTIDTTTAVQPANVSLSSKLDTENIPNGTLKTIMMVETSTNMSGSITSSNVNVNLTTPVPILPRIFNNTITSALIEANISSTFKPDIIGIVTTLISTNINETSSILSSTESISSDIQFTEQPVNTNTEMEFIIETTNADTLNLSQTTTESSITEIINNSVEDIETNIIQQLNSTIPSQMTESTSTTEFTTTEEIPNDIIQTLPIPTTTLRTRLIDFAQDILSHLQNNLSTTVTIQEPINTATYSESNMILDSSSTNIENPTTEMQETKTMQEIGIGNIMTTIASQLNMETTDQSADIESVQTTTATTDGSMQEMTIQNILDLDTPDPSIEQRLSSNVEATLNSDSMTTTQDTRNLGNSSTDAEIATTSMPSFVGFIVENDPSFNNDTLLTELMTIAKSLFSEVMNDTQQSSFVPSQINDFEATVTPDVSNLSRANSMIENENKNQITSSSDTSEKTTTSSIFPTSSENIIERTNAVTSIDFPRNKAGENFNRVPIESKISLMEFNTRSTDVESSVDDAMLRMSLSHIKKETPNTITPVSMNFELITNISDSQTSNPTQPIDNNTERRTILAIDSAQNQLTTLLNDVEFTMDFTTNNSFVMDSITANVTEMFADLKETTDMSMENGLTTNIVITEIDLIEMNDANQVIGLTTIKPATDSTNDRFLVANILNTTTMLPLMSDDNVTDMSDMTNTQLFNTELPTTKSARNLVNSIETTTNQFNDITTNGPQMITNLISQTPNLIARFQDTTTATSTAQGTAGSSIIQPEQTTETITIPTTTASSIAPIISSTFPESFTIDTTTPSPSIKTTAATTRTTTTMTTTTAIPETIRLLSQADLITTGLPEITTTGLIFETTTPIIDINENLVSTEASMRGTTVIPNKADDLNIISKMDVGEISMTTTTMSTAVPTTPINTSAAPMATSTTQTSISNGTMRFAPINIFNTMPFFGRFSNSQMTPAPRPSSSSRAPVRDYLIYGIYPNKTIVRKRPEDNLIDPRNVDSPYVIFGIYPDGRLVRKFPNGTIIPDSPRNPVEVVFTLSTTTTTTTTTNRPAPRPFYNQANQAVTYNRYQAPVYYNNRRPVNELTRGGQNPSPIDFGLTGNAIGIPSGVGPIFAKPFGLPASAPSTNKMSDILLNTQMGTLPNAASAIGNMQMPNNVQSQNPIIQDRDISEASRTRITSDQRSSVYIGQNKFINYQIDSAPNVNAKVVDVKINSVATSVNEGTASSTASIPSFENLLNNQSSNGIITAPPGFPWKDPLDQIFGITTSSPMQIASIASNQLDESEGNVSIMPRPINRQVEVFTPITSLTTSTTPTVTNATTSTTKATSTTTAATTTTTTMTTTTTTTTTTSTTTPMTITTMPSITPSTTPSTVRLATTASSIIAKAIPRSTSSTLSASDVLNELQTNTKENVFGTTFNDLVFLNSLLQNNNVKTTTPKTLNEVEQMLANKILSLALAKPGPTRSPKAIQNASLNANLNSIKDLPSSSPPSEPIIIDLLPHSTSNLDLISTPTIKKQLETSTSLTRSNILPVTTKAPVVITAKPKTTTRPKINITTQAPREFGMTLWRALFGGNFFDTTTAASIKQKPLIKTTSHKPIQITQKPIEIIQKPVKSTTYTSHIMSAVPNKSSSHTTERSIQVSDIQVSSTASFADSIGSASASTPTSISSTTLLNNPNPRLENILTSTYSPEDDAKFLATLLKAIQTQSQISKSTTTQRTITEDDEAFLRAILNQQSNILSTTIASSSSKVNPAALLALLLKEQGIEPSTPATNLREQLQLASLGLTTQSQPDPALITIRPSITTTKTTTTTTKMKPIFSSTSQLTVGTTKKVTPKPSSRPRLQTTTWSPSSTYPPPLFGENSGSGLVTATRVFGRFLGAAISNAAQQFQSLLRNGTINIG